jgi:hypothetical protein
MTDLCDAAVVGRGEPGASAVRWSRRPLVSCVLLGVGLGGFVDGIVLHQILQWHHMLTATVDHPADTVAGLEANTLADGLFHAAAWIFVAAGIVVLRRAWAVGLTAPGLPAQVGAALVGWGRSTWWRASSTTTCSGCTTYATTSPTPCGGTSASWSSARCWSPSASFSCVVEVPRRRARQVRARRRVSIVSPIRGRHRPGASVQDDGRRPRDRLGALAFLIGTMVRSIVVERTGHRSMWRECFVAEFGQSTFRDLAGRVPAALLVRRARRPRYRRGSAASKDGDQTIEAALRRIEERLGTLSRPPPTTRAGPGSCPGRRSR